MPSKPESKIDKFATAPRGEAADALRGHLLRLYAAALGTEYPIDDFLYRSFRERTELAVKARGFIAATLFALLRRRIRTRALLAARYLGHLTDCNNPEERHIEARAAVLRWLIEDLGEPATEAWALLQAALHSEGARGHKIRYRQEDDYCAQEYEGFPSDWSGEPDWSAHPPEWALEAEYGLPWDLLSRWRDRFGADDALALSRFLHAPSALQIRANTPIMDVDRLGAFLEASEAPNKRLRFSPDGIELLRKIPLGRIENLEQGTYEVQEEASQLVAHAVAPQSGWRILDACAGSGGKSLHMAALAPGAIIIAHDQDPNRASALDKRRNRSGAAHAIQPIPPGSAEHHGPYDAVLIDAPCLGLGRLARDPVLAWRKPLAERLAAITADQDDCLRVYTSLVRPGGVLVYATCSFEPEETDELLARNAALLEDFDPEPLPAPVFDNPALNDGKSPDGSRLTLLPHRHGTDGFYIARFRRKQGNAE